MMLRVIFFGVVVIAGFILPTPALIIVAALYAALYPAYELVALGILLDASYGVGAFGVPFPFLYTLAACVIVAVMAIARPYLSFSAQRPR